MQRGVSINEVDAEDAKEENEVYEKVSLDSQDVSGMRTSKEVVTVVPEDIPDTCSIKKPEQILVEVCLFRSFQLYFNTRKFLFSLYKP